MGVGRRKKQKNPTTWDRSAARVSFKRLHSPVVSILPSGFVRPLPAPEDGPRYRRAGAARRNVALGGKENMFVCGCMPSAKNLHKENVFACACWISISNPHKEKRVRLCLQAVN